MLLFLIAFYFIATTTTATTAAAAAAANTIIILFSTLKDLYSHIGICYMKVRGEEENIKLSLLNFILLLC